MAPLLVLVVATLILRLAGATGVRPLASWRAATRVGLAVMFVFTGSTHFTSLKHDYAAMVPPPFTGELWIISLSGVLEIAGGVGLLIPKTSRVAGIGLCLLLLGLFPANVYAALHRVEFRGAPPTDLLLRAVLQAIFLGAVWWSAVLQHRQVSPLPQTAS